MERAPYHARRASFEAGGISEGASVLIEDSPVTWRRRRTHGTFGVRLPAWYSLPLRFAVLGSLYRENHSGNLPTAVRPEGFFFGSGLRVTWDRYNWQDIAPHGVRVTFEAQPGIFRDDAGAMRSRHAAFLRGLFAQPLGTRGVLVANGVTEVLSAGDPNHAALVGNVSTYRSNVGAVGGIRGLRDNVYRVRAHAYGNVEARYAVPVARRVFVQGVAFVDFGVLSPLRPDGSAAPAVVAASAGIGVRLLPTLLADAAPRLDVSRALAPEPGFFVTIGLSQHY